MLIEHLPCARRGARTVPGDTDVCGMRPWECGCRSRGSEVERETQAAGEVKEQGCVSHRSLPGSDPQPSWESHYLIHFSQAIQRTRSHFHTVYPGVTHTSSQSSNYRIQFKALHYMQRVV